MTNKQNELQRPVNNALLARQVLLAALIPLILMIIFLSGVKHPDPSWPKLWMVRPLIIAPAAGALGGAIYYFINHITSGKGRGKILGNILSLLIYIFGLWMGFVLGLAGTLWD